MSRLSMTCAVLAVSTCLTGPMLAQATSPSAAPDSQNQSMPMNGPSTTTPSTAPSQSMQSSPTQGQTTATDLTGQTIYSSKGSKIGKVTAMSTDAHGQQAAAVSVEKFLGMGGQTVLIPVSSLQARSAGGYTTSLSSTEIKSLATSGSSSTTTP